MIGAAVFTSAGFSLATLRSPVWVLVCWAIGGAIAVCGAISYGALAVQIRESGGEYVYLARRVHPLVGFLAGWVSLLAGFTGALAFAASTFEVYAAPLFQLEVPRGTIAVPLIVLCAVQHSLGVAGGALLQNVVVIAKLLGLVVLLVLGMGWLVGRQPLEPIPPADFAWTELARQLTYVYLAYAGFNAAVYVTEEVRNPRHILPRAMLVGTVVVTLLYLGLNTVLVFAGPLDQLAGQKDIAAVAMGLLGGPSAEVFTRVLIATALATSASALTMSGPRVYAKMSADGLFPLPVTAGSAPHAAIALQAVLAIIVVLVVGLEQQLGYLGFVLMLSSAGAVATLFGIRSSDPDDRPTWWQLTAAALFVVAVVLLAVLTTRRDPYDPVLLAGIITLAAGMLAYYILRAYSNQLKC